MTLRPYGPMPVFEWWDVMDDCVASVLAFVIVQVPCASSTRRR
jgi:hypothetical protein